VPVSNERGNVVMLLRVGVGRRSQERGERKEVARAWRAVGDQGEDFGYQTLLYLGVLCF